MQVLDFKSKIRELVYHIFSLKDVLPKEFFIRSYCLAKVKIIPKSSYSGIAEISRNKVRNKLYFCLDNLRKLLPVCMPSGPIRWKTATSLQSLTLKITSVVLAKLQSIHL